MKRYAFSFAPILSLLLSLLGCAAADERHVPPSGYRDWRIYGGGSENIRYSTLDQIDRTNVHRLQVAWTFDTGDAFEGSEMQCNPIVVDGVFYATSPRLNVIALDAATGEPIWRFDPHEGEQVRRRYRNRGVTYWGDGDERRIFVVVDHDLYALDVRTGRPVPEFGEAGRVDFRLGLGRDVQGLTVTATTPGVIYRDLLIMGSLVSEALPGAPGHIRAYDARTGELRWRFNTIPHPGEYGYETWPPDAWMYIGGANSWAGMTVDVERGLVFVPTGSAAFDFYGGNRLGDNLFANSLIALEAETGERVWHFQFVRHDLWDWDLPAPPSLVTVRRDGRLVDAVSQTTKHGYVFLFHRETGEPLFPIEHRPVPQTDVPGEATADTQPFPLLPTPFARQRFTEDLVTARTPESHRAVLERLRTLRNEGPFTPPSFQGTVIFPGFDGGAEWGGTAFDPETGILYVNSNEMAWVLRLVERPRQRERMSARDLYLAHCAGCHRPDLEGTPPEFPSLKGLRERSKEAVNSITRDGAGLMPGFSHLGDEAIQALTEYLLTGESREVDARDLPPTPIDLPYRIDGYNKFLDPDGYPAVKPPWGTLTAIDLDTGEFAWQIPFGEFPELAERGLRNTGSENYGGPAVTAGGLLFIGATNHDSKFRAFDKATGELLWETTLPAAGNATPAVYEVDGRQFVVIASGGGKWGLPSEGTYVAFALP